MRILTIILAALLSRSPLLASTYTVNSDGDATDATHGDDLCATSSSVCTFRAAVEEANTHDGFDTIAMGSSTVITPATLLPDLMGPLVVDALGCTGTCGTTYRLEIQGNSSLARGLLLNGAVLIRGVKVTGTFDSPSAAILIGGIGGMLECAHIDATANTGVNIVSDAVGTRILNSIIDGVPSGDCLGAGDAESVLIQGNTIRGCEDGVYLAATTGAVLYNHTSNQTHNGIHIDSGSNGVIVRGNRSGTSADAMSADTNGQEGLRINNSDDVQVGGALAGQRNILSGNTGPGVWIMGTSDDTHVEGNYLGLNASATPSLCNGDRDLRNDGTDTTEYNNVACPTPTPSLGCCTVTGAASCIDYVIAGFLSLPLTNLTDCQTMLDTALGTGYATATAYNANAVCQGVSTPGTGTCP